ncbi:MAG: hypothetical protein AB1705_27320 [Verrucomicrobiota bacterium]
MTGEHKKFSAAQHIQFQVNDHGMLLPNVRHIDSGGFLNWQTVKLCFQSLREHFARRPTLEAGGPSDPRNQAVTQASDPR